MTRVAVVGTGYVGLTTGACLASLGHDVTCLDVDLEKVTELSSGRVRIVEAGLQSYVQEALEAGRLRFLAGSAESVGDAEVVMLCLPTPEGADGAADMSFVLEVAGRLGPVLRPGAIVVNKSTVPIGSSRRVEAAIGRCDVRVVSNPEFLREGSAVSDFLHPDRVVIGSDDSAAADLVASLYSALGAPVLFTDPASAETIKYASNAFLAMKLSFVNSMAELCEHFGANILHVTQGMGYDRRIGPAFLQPGPGWGGSCFPKDTLALLSMAEAAGCDSRLIRSTIDVNDAHIARVVAKIEEQADGSLPGKTVGIWGLTFKAGTDDLRGSPAVRIAAALVDAGARVLAYDPAVRRSPTVGVEITSDPYGAVQGASVLALLTEWEEFRGASPTKTAAAMASLAVVDGRNVLDGDAWRDAGFRYLGVGLP